MSFLILIIALACLPAALSVVLELFLGTATVASVFVSAGKRASKTATLKKLHGKTFYNPATKQLEIY